MKLVLIQWHDAVSDESGWKSTDAVRKQKPPLVKSVGWMIARSDSHVTLAASIVEDHCDGDVTIPTGMIVSITDLVERKRGKT